MCGKDLTIPVNVTFQLCRIDININDVKTSTTRHRNHSRPGPMTTILGAMRPIRDGVRMLFN